MRGESTEVEMELGRERGSGWEIGRADNSVRRDSELVWVCSSLGRELLHYVANLPSSTQDQLQSPQPLE
jgi:hypothetical protein